MKPRYLLVVLVACLLAGSAWGQTLLPLKPFVAPTTAGDASAVVVQGPDGKPMLVLSVGNKFAFFTILGVEQPTPPGPDVLTGLAGNARDWALALPADPKRAEEAAALARSFEAVAARIAAGTLADADAIVAATAEANQAAIGAHRDYWLPWATRLKEYLNGESKAGRLKTLDQHREAWLQIAKGLGAVK